MILLVFGALCQLHAQLVKGDATFHHLGVSDGLNDVELGGICEDANGLMWFPSLGAINQFNGTEFIRYIGTAGDSTGPYPDICYSVARDSSGILWFGYSDRLISFDPAEPRFRTHPALSGIGIYQMEVLEDGHLYIRTPGIPLCYDTKAHKLLDPAATLTPDQLALFAEHRTTSLAVSDDVLMIGSTGGLLIFKPGTQEIRWLAVPAIRGAISTIAPAQDGYWVSDRTHYQLLHIKQDGALIATYDSLLTDKATGSLARIAGIVSKDGDTWIGTTTGKLFHVSDKTPAVTVYTHDARDARSLSSSVITRLYRSNQGIIWIAGDAGIDYFHQMSNCSV